VTHPDIGVGAQNARRVIEMDVRGTQHGHTSAAPICEG
jgi:hypothetical protein